MDRSRHSGRVQNNHRLQANLIKNMEPQKTAVAPQKTAVAPQGTAVAPQGTAVAPQQKTAVAPQQKTAVAPQQSNPSTKPSGNKVGDTITRDGRTLVIEKCLGSGSEGDIYVVSEGNKRYALKLYHNGFSPHKDLLPVLAKLKNKHYVIDIISYGDDYELMELATEGSVASMSLRGNAKAILAITVKIAMALSEMHKIGIVHKDVKPANILVQNKTSWDCVLCDFGIADKLNQEGVSFTEQVRTPIYAAPEVYDTKTTVNKDGKTYSRITKQADYYSLGMTILSLWMGESAFRSKEDEMSINKKMGLITIPSDMPDPLAKICRGLLLRNPEKRWGYEQIEQTLRGKNVTVEEEQSVPDLNITYNATKHQIANTPEQLADFMLEDLDLAKKYLYRGQIEKWLKTYPELAMEMQDITEKRLPKNQDRGVMAAIYHLNPETPFTLTGISKEKSITTTMQARTLKDVSSFCSENITKIECRERIASDAFIEWVRVRDKKLASALPKTDTVSKTMFLRMQTIDPLSDISGINDTKHPSYAMTQEGIGRLLNEIYNLYWNKYVGNMERLRNEYYEDKNSEVNKKYPWEVVSYIINDFRDPKNCHYILDFFDTKGNRFSKQRRWVQLCTNNQDPDYQKKAGPKDVTFFMQMSWMKVIKGFGVTPEYKIYGDNAISFTTRTDAFTLPKTVLKNEYEKKGLRGWLAVQHQENPHANLQPLFAYEQLLKDYLDDLTTIDAGLEPVRRFADAQANLQDVLDKGKKKIYGLTIRTTIQMITNIVLAVVPAALLILVLVLSIIANPVIDTSSLQLDGLVWIVGIIISVIAWLMNEDGCIIPVIVGVIGGFLAKLAVIFLGRYILYIYVLIVILTTGYFVWKTLLHKSIYSDDARRFNQPGFEENVLEPLYYAFSNDRYFDSSLNGAFSDNDIDGWKDDLNGDLRLTLTFIASIWFLAIFSIFVPKTPAVEQYTAPLAEKWQSVFGSSDKQEEASAKYLDAVELKVGDSGEQVVLLQQFLKDAGYTHDNPDGKFGKGTESMVRRFQKTNNLPVTGIVDAETIEFINKWVAEVQQWHQGN